MTGLIAYFDILGYKNLLKNNPESASEAVEAVLNFIQKKPKEIISAVSTGYNSVKDNAPLAADASSRVKTLIFSDSIILSIEYPKDAKDEWKETALYILSILSNGLCGMMFDYGLPVRGAMVEGDFLIKDNCFAGKAIVDAYELSEKLDLAGFVFDWQFNKKIEYLLEKYAVLHPLFVSYLTPLKTLGEERIYHANWLSHHSQNRIDFIASDIEKYVLRSFWDHRKDCPKAVDSKIANTCKLIRKFVIMNDIRLSRNPQ